jgi:hypothetical protein
MSNNDDNFSVRRKTMSTSNIRNNFKKPVGSSKVNIYKIIAFSVILISGVFLMFKSCGDEKIKPPISLPEEYVDTAAKSSPIKNVDTAVAKNNKNSNPISTPKLTKIRVFAADLDQLRIALANKSTVELSSGNFTPINLKFNLSNYSISFELDPIPSNIRKLSLLWGPINSGGCVSCLNAIQKNPGSFQVYTSSDGSFEYGIIAISN